MILKNGGNPSNIDLSWGVGCPGHFTGYALYEGVLPVFYGHGVFNAICNLAANSAANQVPGAGDHYYLVVPVDATTEGSYGLSTLPVAEIPPGAIVCRPTQNLAPCP